MRATANTQLTRPGPAPAQPPAYAQGAPPPQTGGAASYPPQPLLAAQPPGYGPFAPFPQVNRGMPGVMPLLPPPNGPPLYPYPPMPPGPAPGLLGQPQFAGRPLPDMVYVVTSRFWIRPEVLLWWTKGEPAPQPIVTIGSATDAVPGAVGQPGTQVLYGGNNSYGFGYIGGFRIESGGWLDAGRVFGVEAGYFALIKQARNFSYQSDAFGNPVIARPTIDSQSGSEGAYLDSLPGWDTGGVQVITHSEFQGANCDGVLNLVQTNRVRLDGLLGFRYLSLSESLNVYDQYNNAVGGARLWRRAFAILRHARRF